MEGKEGWFFWANGDIWKGPFLNGFKHGTGKFIVLHGKSIFTTYHNGIK